jgi:hypothetical protein
MAFLGQNFTTDELPQGTGYDPLPEGWYTATITKADLNDTKSGTGQKIDVRYDITGPSHQGRVTFGSFNIFNQSAKAEEIGRQQFGDLLRAIGLPQCNDTDLLIGHSVQIKVAIKPAENGYEARNEVKGWKSVAGGAAPAVSAHTAAPAVTSAPSGGKPPWAK